MRVLFLFLVLLNVAYFTWRYIYPAPQTIVEPGGVVNDATGIATLILLTERDRSAAQEAQSPPGAPPQPQPQPLSAVKRCLRAGPTADRGVLERLQVKLAEIEVQAEISVQTQQIPIGYWVHLPSTRSERQARLEMQALQSKGVRDISLVPSNDGQFVVSLGVFSRADTSEARLAGIRRLGYAPVRDERYKTTAAFILTAVAVGSAVNQLEAILAGVGVDLPAEFSVCQ